MIYFQGTFLADAAAFFFRNSLHVEIEYIISISQMINCVLIRLRTAFCSKKTQSLTNFFPQQKNKAMQEYLADRESELVEQVRKLPLKQFSIKVHRLVVGKEKSPLFWSTVQQEFLQRLQPTTDPVHIRSYAKVLFALSKSKKATVNYETKVALILPFASPQSFTEMTTALSRIAPYSQEFGYILEKLYYQRKSQFRPREIISINYSLANNGRKCDQELIKLIDHFNAVQTITMLRSYDKSELITPQILKTTMKKIRSVTGELNVLDLADLMYVYLKYDYVPQQMLVLFEQSYASLKSNINDICFEKIWTYFPDSVNKGRLRVGLVEEILTTLQILRKSRNMSEVIWKRIQPSFQNFENIELRLRLQKIY